MIPLVTLYVMNMQMDSTFADIKGNMGMKSAQEEDVKWIDEQILVPVVAKLKTFQSKALKDAAVGLIEKHNLIDYFRNENEVDKTEVKISLDLTFDYKTVKTVGDKTKEQMEEEREICEGLAGNIDTYEIDDSNTQNMSK